MDARVMDLIPGDKVRMDFDGSQYGICIGTISPHPLDPYLWLVIWRVYPVQGAPFWSHDALSPFQLVGYYVRPRNDEHRKACLLTALHSNLQAANKMMGMEAEAAEKFKRIYIDRGE